MYGNELLDLILAKGYDVHEFSPEHFKKGATVLHWLCSRRHNEEIIGEQVVRLVELGIDLNSTGASGWTPLREATDSDNFPAVRSLCRLGADPNITDNRGETPIFHSSKVEVFDLLVDAGADLGSCCERGQTALFEAVRYQRNSVVERMIELGFNVNHRDHTGSTALYGCWGEHQREMAQVIPGHGADPLVKNNEGKLPYEHRYHTVLKDLLLEEGYIQ